MFTIKNFWELMRIKQWYKNIVIFLPLIFSLNFFNIKLFLFIVLGFFSLSLMSSSYYIINDLKDIEKDKYHPEKKKRPLVSGKISKIAAFFIFLFFFISSLFLSYSLSNKFFYSILGLFLLSQLYSFYLRKIAFLDIVVISINFVIRTISGVFLLNIPVSSWVVLCPFFLSIFLVSGKRISEIGIENFEKYRCSLKEEHKETLNLMAIISATSVIILFCIYSVILSRPLVLITLPVSFYIVLLYFNNIYGYPEKIRNPEKFIFDKKILISLIIWGILLVFSLYFP